VLAGCGDVSADRVQVPGGFLAAEPPGDLLLGLGGHQVPFSVVRGVWNPQVTGEPQDVIAPVAERFEQGPVPEADLLDRLERLGRLNGPDGCCSLLAAS
jgi:hypothetical protein